MWHHSYIVKKNIFLGNSNKFWKAKVMSLYVLFYPAESPNSNTLNLELHTTQKKH